MTITEAAQFLKTQDVEAITRKAWDNTHFIIQDTEDPNIINKKFIGKKDNIAYTFSNFKLTIEDLTATDWEVKDLNQTSMIRTFKFEEALAKLKNKECRTIYRNYWKFEDGLETDKIFLGDDGKIYMSWYNDLDESTVAVQLFKDKKEENWCEYFLFHHNIYDIRIADDWVCSNQLPSDNILFK